MDHKVKILRINQVTHDVKEFITEKPQGYIYVPGQATVVSVNKSGLEDEKRPFTFTSLNDDKYLEFIIKIYSEKHGVTDSMDELKEGDELFINEPWGAIKYKGPGYFIAGGAGITPFIAILRQLKKEGEVDGNMLFFSNKTREDIILEDELRDILGDKVIFTLTRQNHHGYHYGRIDEKFLKEHIKDLDKEFYVCGTPEMTDEVGKTLEKLGASPD
ncbi:MAG: FAD-binding oxidoreductase, partial [Bacteroidota bacterium]